MIRLSCSFKTYDWGKLGHESEVFNLLSGCTEKSDLPNDIPFAELWMGTHLSGPSHIYGDENQSLATFISFNPEVLGRSGKMFGRTLPFLFKVLSVRKALSIQAHPNKSHAQELHRNRPDIYKDANHKPELAIALTPFEALLAFRPVSEIACFVQGIPELLEVIGIASATDLSSVSDDTECVAIKAAYERLMRADVELISDRVNRLHQRLKSGSKLDLTLPESSRVNLDVLREVFIRLADEYPGDCGCFSLFFLNYIRLEPGQAVFLEANLPHAYISGDCVECMACSDNVVRAGLTPKFKDVDCLLSMLQYEPRTNNRIIFPPKECSIRIPDSKMGLTRDLMPTVFTYAPPVEEFAVDRICIPAKCEAFHLFASPSASILIIISGSGRFQVFLPKDRDNENPKDPRSDSLTEEKGSSYGSEKGEIVYAGSVNQMIGFHRGMVFFVHANVSFSLHPATPNNDSILAFRAYANVDMISQSEDTIYDKTSSVVLGQARQM